MSVTTNNDRSLKSQIIRFVRNLNAYQAAHEDTPAIRRNQILATRVYIFSLAFCMFVLVQYTALSRQTITGKLENPSLASYERLETLYPDSLSCPCSQIAVSSGFFIGIEATFHQVCCRLSIQLNFFKATFLIWAVIRAKE